MLAQAAVLLARRADGRLTATLSLGAFFAFNLLLNMLVAPLRMLGMWIGQAQRATASGERIFEVIDEPEDVADRAAGVRAAAPDPAGSRSRASRFAYEDGPPVLDGIDLEIEPGTTVALIGRSGSGKTTLASLVPRFYDATAGSVTVDGVDVRDVTRRSLRRAIGVISQDPFLFSASVRDNIAFGVPGVPRRGGRGGGPGRAGARVHREAAARLRHGDRRARHHALGRAAPADRDRARARDRSADPDPRRRDRVGRRDDRGPDPRRAQGGDARTVRRS